jgi:hypothetical protein
LFAVVVMTVRLPYVIRLSDRFVERGSMRFMALVVAISRRVVDVQDLPVPGVTVTAQSSTLQGARVGVTLENGVS